MISCQIFERAQFFKHKMSEEGEGGKKKNTKKNMLNSFIR